MTRGDEYDQQYISELGTKIRMARRKLNLTLEEVAHRVGVTRSFLSQVERGVSAPSITILRHIANALRIPVFLLFNTEISSKNTVVKKDERQIIVLPKATTVYQLLSPDLNRKIEMILTELEVGSSSCDEPLSHDGEECAHILSGKALIKVGDEDYILEKGDSLYFDCSQPHRITNIGNETLKIISSITPPSF